MPVQRFSRTLAVLSLVAALAAACVNTSPTETATPGASAPVQSPTALVTLAPGATATVAPLDTATPGSTLPPETPFVPTAPPTLPPTENPHPNWPAGAVGAAHADEVVGQNATICGNVDTIRWLYSSDGHPTWINFNRPYPNMKFNAVIWGEARREWSLNNKPEVMYAGHQICVTGLVEAYQGWYQIQNLHKADIQIVD